MIINILRQVSAALFGLIFILLAGACTDDPMGGGPPISDIPYIELRAVNPGNVTAFEDSIVFELYYLDGDGDLGFESADSAVVYLTDTRFPLIEEFHVQPIAPEGSNIIISGIWQVVLPFTILQDPLASSELAIFSLRIRDRAGNSSNTVISVPITVIAP
ncbi:MAG: hypothetical protein ACI959_000770 [Limisphaerales bacterium]|jgi:hypothetical protein